MADLRNSGNPNCRAPRDAVRALCSFQNRIPGRTSQPNSFLSQQSRANGGDADSSAVPGADGPADHQTVMLRVMTIVMRRFSAIAVEIRRLTSKAQPALAIFLDRRLSPVPGLTPQSGLNVTAGRHIDFYVSPDGLVMANHPIGGGATPDGVPTRHRVRSLHVPRFVRSTSLAPSSAKFERLFTKQS
jgi:hypothetical protein